MYRSKSWERGRRDREKAEKKKTWYAKLLILLKNMTLYLRSNILQRFEHYSSSGVKVSRGAIVER